MRTSILLSALVIAQAIAGQGGKATPDPTETLIVIAALALFIGADVMEFLWERNQDK